MTWCLPAQVMGKSVGIIVCSYKHSLKDLLHPYTALYYLWHFCLGALAAQLRYGQWIQGLLTYSSVPCLTSTGHWGQTPLLNTHIIFCCPISYNSQYSCYRYWNMMQWQLNSIQRTWHSQGAMKVTSDSPRLVDFPDNLLDGQANSQASLKSSKDSKANYQFNRGTQYSLNKSVSE